MGARNLGVALSWTTIHGWGRSETSDKESFPFDDRRSGSQRNAAVSPTNRNNHPPPAFYMCHGKNEEATGTGQTMGDTGTQRITSKPRMTFLERHQQFLREWENEACRWYFIQVGQGHLKGKAFPAARRKDLDRA
jgi:hypothetical protein